MTPPRSGPDNAPITEHQSQSLLMDSRSTKADAEILRKIANNSMHESEAMSHIIRLMFQCADLRRRLEAP